MGSFFSILMEKYKTTKELWSLTLLILLSVLFYIINPAFLSALNISNFFAYFPELGIMALSMTYLLISGEFDLSIGALFAFAPVVMFALRNNLGVPIDCSFGAPSLVSLEVAPLRIFGVFSSFRFEFLVLWFSIRCECIFVFDFGCFRVDIV